MRELDFISHNFRDHHLAGLLVVQRDIIGAFKPNIDASFQIAEQEVNIQAANSLIGGVSAMRFNTPPESATAA
ncbi:hypothetical protein, partial [Salmonella sp. SAL04284]|uniref:hypothetical protein n=1 Tax=Salmonella sp. SAL04284 TaxID=3159862 RepID=UPI00397DA767